MDPDSIQTVLWMLLLLVVSAFFSAAQAAFAACNESRLKTLAEAGDRRAGRTLRLMERLEKLPAALPVGDTLANILFAVLAVRLFTALYGGAGAAIATAAATAAVLLFCDTAPEALARVHADRWAVAVTPFVRVALVVLYPLGWIFSLWMRLLQTVFKPADTQNVTEEDLLTIVEEAEQEGSIDEQESDLLRRVITFDDREVEDILLPRVEVVGLPADATPAEMAAVFAETGFSRLPVYEETMDTILGVVHLKDFTGREKADALPTDIMKPAVFVPPTMKIRLLLKKLQEEKSHIAIVSDEYGGTLGIVTMEDILEELVGDIWDEHDDVVENIRAADEGFVVLCSTELPELMDFFERETACEATTVSGWVTEVLERIPVAGDSFTADGLQVTVLKADTARPEEILVVPVAPSAESDSEKDE